jgi:hypothetical protein
MCGPTRRRSAGLGQHFGWSRDSAKNPVAVADRGATPENCDNPKKAVAGKITLASPKTATNFSFFFKEVKLILTL